MIKYIYLDKTEVQEALTDFGTFFYKYLNIYIAELLNQVQHWKGIHRLTNTAAF